MRRVLMVSSSLADGAAMSDVKTFTAATATWTTLLPDGDGAVQGTPPSARTSMLLLAAASKMWVFGGSDDDGKSKQSDSARLVQQVVVASTVVDGFVSEQVSL